MNRLAFAVIGGVLAFAAAAPTDPSVAPVTDDAKLPRVLLIGDSISMGYTVPVRKLLAGTANVHRPPENCQSTVYALEKLDEWIGAGKWDVIHFNWGIWDAHHLEDGRLRSTPEQYEENLRRLVTKLKDTKAKLVFATTTPLETRHYDKLWVQDSDIPVYNEVAKKVMAEQGVPVDDLYAAVLPRVGELRTEDGVHFTDAGSEFLAERVAESIKKALNASEEKSQDVEDLKG